MRFGRWVLLAGWLLSPQAWAEPPSAPALVVEASHPFSFADGTLAGPGADFLRGQTANSEFVLLGEQHMDHAVPLFAGALYRMLRSAHGFRTLIVEQDPLSIEAALAPGVRGNVEVLARLARRYPALFEFSSDEDLTFLSLVGGLEPGADAVWGVEQATGATYYLEQLAALAPSTAVRDKVEASLAAARVADPGPGYSVNWLLAESTPSALAALTTAFAAAPGSRAAQLLSALTKSSEIYGYYRRAEAGEFVGLYNNTVREEVLKANFLSHYRALVGRGRPPPKALFKFGANHLFHGKNLTQVFPIGNLAHELAIVNGMDAYGLYLQPLGQGYLTYQDVPAWLHPLLPPSIPTAPTVVDLRRLRPYQRLFLKDVQPADAATFLSVLHGYEALVLLPGSRPAVWTLGGSRAK